MGAAEDEGGNLEIEERLEVLGEDKLNDGVGIFAAFFDQRDEERAGAGEDVNGRIEPADGGGVGVGGDGGFGSDEAHTFSDPVTRAQATSTAAVAPGSRTPMTGMSNSVLSLSRARAEAVLQATHEEFGGEGGRKRRHWRVKRWTVAGDLVP